MKRSHSFSACAGRAVRSASLCSALAWLAALAGCSSSPPLFAPDGRPTTQVQCPSGSNLCEQRAQADCGGAYEVVRQSSDAGTRSLLYACKTR
jgi:hypothetical protein